MPPRVIVVGGGCKYFPPSSNNPIETDNTVSGLSAAHTIYLAGGNVVVLDKQGECRNLPYQSVAQSCIH